MQLLCYRITQWRRTKRPHIKYVPWLIIAKTQREVSISAAILATRTLTRLYSEYRARRKERMSFSPSRYYC